MVNPKIRSKTEDGRTITVNFDIFTKVSGLVVDLYPVVQEFFKGGAVENTISGRTRIVNNKFMLSGGDFGGFWLRRETQSAY